MSGRASGRGGGGRGSDGGRRGGGGSRSGAGGGGGGRGRSTSPAASSRGGGSSVGGRSGGGSSVGARSGGGGSRDAGSGRGGGESRGGGGRSDIGRAGGRDYSRGGGGRGDFGRGGGGSGGGGRGDFGRGGGGHGAPDNSKLDKVLTNILPATVSPSFEFYMYGIDSKNKNDEVIESRGRRLELFQKGFWDDLLKGMTKAAKDDLRRVVYFAGSFFFSARAIPGLESSKLPYDLVLGNDTQGDTMIVVNVTRFTTPTELLSASPTTIVQGMNKLQVDPTRCGDCTKTFTSVESALQHSREKGHMLSYVSTAGEAPAPMDVFKAFVNLALQKAMGERLLRWGKEFYDKTAPMPAKDRNGNDLGVTIFEAISLVFDLKKFDGKTMLVLTCDISAKVIRNKSVLDMIYEERRNPDADYTEQEKQQLKRKWIGEIVIYKNDKKCYSVVDLEFKHSPASLPIPGKGISHQEYFKQKGIILQYPYEKPMIVVEGRRKQHIYLPPELVSGNELDPKVREMLPTVASFKPEKRNKAIEKIKTFLIPATQTSTGGSLLPSIGITLQPSRLQAKATVLSCPELIAGGIPVPQKSAENWAPMLSKANFNVAPKESIELNVVVFYHRDLERGTKKVYGAIRDLVNKFNTSYRFGQNPYALVPTGENEQHWGTVEKFFSGKLPPNMFVLDFCKPRTALDTAYPVVKQILTKSGYVSQFVNFKTYAHHEPRDERKSSMILQGVSRQVLQKSGMRLWWVTIPKTLPLPTVFVGVDVFHAPVVYDPKTKAKGRKASVSAIVIEVIREHNTTPTKVEMYSKTCRREGGVEYSLGTELKESMNEGLRELKVVPASVVIWRDGMPETAYGHANEEIHGIREGVKLSTVGTVGSSNPNVPLAYIVCQKRIATKFLTVDGKFGAPSGTMVTSIQEMMHQTFYINGRSPPFSTPKPVRFICMARDPGLQSVPLAQLTWGQCHAYPNWSGPIKVPSVTMQAHKLSELAGSFIDGGDNINNKAFKNKVHYL